jgi:hypothetical protein
MADEQWDAQEDLDLQAAIAMSLVCSSPKFTVAAVKSCVSQPLSLVNCANRSMGNGWEQPSEVNGKHASQGQEVPGGKRGAEDELEGEGGGPPDADSGLTFCSWHIVLFNHKFHSHSRRGVSA